LATKLSAFVATSINGFIARKDGNIDWLNKPNKQESELQDFGYSNFMKSIEVIVMGRKTFEQVITFDKWPFEKKEVIVLSSKNIKISKTLSKTVKTSKESPKN
jgi:dihydrofolate reductase